MESDYKKEKKIYQPISPGDAVIFADEGDFYDKAFPNHGTGHILLCSQETTKLYSTLRRDFRALIDRAAALPYVNSKIRVSAKTTFTSTLQKTSRTSQ